MEFSNAVLHPPRRAAAAPIRSGMSRAANLAIPTLIAGLAAGAAYAGADTTFDPALTQFTNFLEGSGGKIITVLSLAGGLIGLASGRFSLGGRRAGRCRHRGRHGRSDRHLGRDRGHLTQRAREGGDPMADPYIIPGGSTIRSLSASGPSTSLPE